MLQKAKSYNSYLTDLAQAAYADESESISALLFPAVEVKTQAGSFKKRDIDAAFRVYDASLARGGTPMRIDTNATEGFYNCKPEALAVGTWKFDLDQDSGTEEAEANLKDLMSTQLITREVKAVQLFRSGIPAISGAGVWSSDSSANIISELDAAILQIHAAIGRMPSHMVIGLSAWNIIRNHASVLSRISGITVDMTVDRLRSMLIHPGIDIRVASLPYQPAKRGKSASREAIVGGDVFVFYSQDAPTKDDLSVGKDFTLNGAGPEVTTYEDEAKLETVDTLYWSTDRQITCPAAGARIAVS